MVLKVPILFLIFKREAHAVRAFESIKLYRPTKLYIAADGSRNEIEEEKKACEATRRAILESIDWDCQVKTLFRDKNLGCSNAVYGGISWFFKNEEYGIIIEEDVVVAQDFFKFCELLLPLYRNEKKVMLISSRNHSKSSVESDEYVFSYYANIWGWASWRRAWALNDNIFRGWNEFPKYNLIRRFGVFQGLMSIYYYQKCSNPNNYFGSWDYTWSYIINKNDGLCICPKVNLSSNVGIGTIASTNYDIDDRDPYASLTIGHLKWPIRLKKEIKPDRYQLRADRRDFLRVRMIGLKKKIRNVVKQLILLGS